MAPGCPNFSLRRRPAGRRFSIYPNSEPRFGVPERGPHAPRNVLIFFGALGSRRQCDFLNVITGNRDVASRELRIRLLEFRVRVPATTVLLYLFSFSLRDDALWHFVCRSVRCFQRNSTHERSRFSIEYTRFCVFTRFSFNTNYFFVRIKKFILFLHGFV